MSHFSVLARKSWLNHSRNAIIKSTCKAPLCKAYTKSIRQCNNHSNNNDGNDNNTFISDNWSDPTQRTIKSVEELSEYGKTLLCSSLFTGNDKEANTEQIYGKWANNYEKDMDTLRFDSLATMPTKVEQYLTETLLNNIDISEEEAPLTLSEVLTNEESNANILDVGCGTGLLGELLLENTNILENNSEIGNGIQTENNITIDGMDLTQEMLDILSKERGD
eukprot:727637_1